MLGVVDLPGMSTPNYITPQGFQKLQSEYTDLMSRERPEVVRLVQWAASNGDRSENADYLYGKKRLREIDRRLRFLASRIEAARVIDPASVRSSKIQFGATVTTETEDGVHKTWKIVGQDEIDTAQGLISWLSPIGKGLLGKSVGEDVTIQTPQGEVNLEVIEILYIT
jgi:transcription elongation factor GreB